MSTVDAPTSSAALATVAAMGRRRRPAARVGAVATVVAVLLAYPYVVTAPFWQNVGVLALTFAIAAAGWNVLGGYAGQVSFGHATFFGTGAYTVALCVRAGWSPWPALVVGGLVAAALGLAAGYPTFRLSGHYFAIATIAVSEIVFTIVFNNRTLGAATGLDLPLKADSLVDLQFSGRDKTPYYLCALGLLAAVSAALWWLVRSRAGVYFRAIRDDPAAAAAAGVPVLRYKLLAVAVSGAVTSVAGGFYAMYVLFVDPPSVLALTVSIQIALVAVLGGAGSLWGPLLGAWVVTALREYTRVELSGSGRAVDLVIYGSLIAVVAIVEPRGLAGLGDRAAGIARRLHRRGRS